MSFKDKVVLVTGASSGIGAATAISFTAEGAKVAMVGRNLTKLNRVAATCEQKGAKPIVILADVSRKEDCKMIVEETLKHFGKLDVLVHNAGMFLGADILAPNAIETYESVMATNFNSVVYTTHFAASHLVDTKGNIVNVSSVTSLGVVKYRFAYHTSKAAMDIFSRAIALELGPKGVRVNTVNPGAVKTDIWDGNPQQKEAMLESIAKKVPLGRYGEPEEIADLILFLASDKARSITGSSYVSDNGALLVGLPSLAINNY